MNKLVGNGVDSVSLSADLLPCLLVSRTLHRGQDHLLQVGVHCPTVHTHRLETRTRMYIIQRTRKVCIMGTRDYSLAGYHLLSDREKGFVIDAITVHNAPCLFRFSHNTSQKIHLHTTYQEL